VRASSALGQNGTIRLEFTKSDGRARTLAIRKPFWASKVDIALKGKGGQSPTESKDGYVQLQRAWKAGDVVEVHYQMRTRIARQADRANQVTLFHGPWLLGVDERLSPNFFDEPHNQNRIVLPAAGENGEVRLDVAAAAKTGNFDVAVAHFKLGFLPGGYGIQPRTAVLRPIAEYTGVDGASLWEFWFVPKSDKN
jgi:DUF1680 family protein